MKRAIVTGFAFISMETKTNQIVNDYPKATERNNLNTRNGILKNETAENQHFGRPRILFHVPLYLDLSWISVFKFRNHTLNESIQKFSVLLWTLSLIYFIP